MTAPSRSAALSMYSGNPPATQVFWQAVRERLAAAGVERLPDTLVWPDDLAAHWRDPELLLGQTCGYPLVTDLAGLVRVLGCFAYEVPGARGVRNRSQVVVRGDEPANTLEAFRGRTVAFNGTESQSGYNALRALIAPLAVDGRFFGRAVQVGAHVASCEAVRDGVADIACIDCISLANFRRYRPESVRGLRVLCETDDYTGLPLITSLRTDDATLERLRSALVATIADPANRPTCAALMLGGFVPLDESAYAKHRAMRDGAYALGVRSL